MRKYVTEFIGTFGLVFTVGRSPLLVLGRRMTRRPREPAFLLIPVPLEEILMSTPDSTPTAVLVHGAFVDASSWNGVITELKGPVSTWWRRRTCCAASALASTPSTSPASSRRSAARSS